MTVSTIHQRPRDEHKLKVSISSFRRWVHATPPDEVSRSQVTLLRAEIEPGEEAQIDHDFLGQWTNPRTGRRHRVWAFVMVLPRSRHMSSCPQCRPSSPVMATFAYGSRVPEILLPSADRLRLLTPRGSRAFNEVARSKRAPARTRATRWVRHSSRDEVRGQGP
ncbi:hypothetical protein OG604_50050 [Streptomyces sp. NBC_01231]|nr:hypothetical protein OG604_50050 [Streptomyces sp. NBC_01231]